MIWIILGAICLIMLAAEAAFIMPDKMPWNKDRRKGKR